MPSNKNKIYFLKKNKNELTLKFYMVGYRARGESILILLLDHEEVIFSILVDYYKTSTKDKIQEILTENNIKTIDLLFLTHPHFDHLQGMDKIIEKYCDPQHTKICLPFGVDGYENEVKNYTEREKKIFKRIKEFALSYKRSKGLANEFTMNPIQPFKCKSNEDEKVIEILATSIFAPIGEVLSKKEEEKNTTPNDYSIGLYLNFCSEFSILLCGDVENETFERIDSDQLEYISILKIPHHSSKTASKLIDTLIHKKSEIELACTTVYRSGSLPRDEILDKYKIISKNIYSTGDIKKNVREEKKHYGLIEVEYSLKTKEMIIKKSGNTKIIKG